MFLFTDGSVNIKSKTGFGSSLIIADLKSPITELKKDIQLIKFKQTSSTKLEIQTLLWALNKNFDQLEECKKIVLFTDSSNIAGLPARRSKLEKCNYISKKNIRLINSGLYKEFYRITDLLNCEIIKIEGHKKSDQKNNIERIFTLVDRASRKAMREDNKI